MRDLAEMVAEEFDLSETLAQCSMRDLLTRQHRDMLHNNLYKLRDEIKAAVRAELDARPPLYAFHVEQYGDPLTIERRALNKPDDRESVTMALGDWWELGREVASE